MWQGIATALGAKAESFAAIRVDDLARIAKFARGEGRAGQRHVARHFRFQRF
jgi:hypothetical protein